jgi:hypothetical protein
MRDGGMKKNNVSNMGEKSQEEGRTASQAVSDWWAYQDELVTSGKVV